MKITIGFSSHKGFAPVGKFIMFILGKNFSHTYFKFKEDLYDDATIFHATGDGLNYLSYTTFLKHNVPVAEFEIDISDDLYNELLKDCHNRAGEPYGYFQNIGIFLVREVKKIFNVSITKNPIDDGINCSEWIYYILEEVYGKWTDTEPNLVAPDEVYDFLVIKLDKSSD